MEEYLSKEDYKKQIDLINEDLSIYQNKITELKSNKKDKNYTENKINEIKKTLEKCLEDNKCYSDVFNELIEKIIVHNQSDKQIKLDIFIKTRESINTLSDNLGKKFHLLDSHTTYFLINDTLTITREISSKYIRNYDVEFIYNLFIKI